jgi:hypothetical protein
MKNFSSYPDNPELRQDDATERQFLEDNIATVDPGEVLKEISRRLTAHAQPITHRWRSFGALTWIYDPEPEWLEDHKFEVEWEPVYGAPQPASVAQPPANPDAVKMYADALDAANARIAELEAREWPVAQGWQDIRTAPRDGTQVLLAIKDNDDEWCQVQGWYEAGPADRRWYDVYHEHVIPDYWKPLAPPEGPSITSTLLCPPTGEGE